MQLAILGRMFRQGRRGWWGRIRGRRIIVGRARVYRVISGGTGGLAYGGRLWNEGGEVALGYLAGNAPESLS